MLRTLSLTALAVAAGLSTVATADTGFQWDWFLGNPVVAHGIQSFTAEPDTYPMYLATLGLMAFIARRRSH